MEQKDSYSLQNNQIFLNDYKYIIVMDRLWTYCNWDIKGALTGDDFGRNCQVDSKHKLETSYFLSPSHKKR